MTDTRSATGRQALTGLAVALVLTGLAAFWLLGQVRTSMAEAASVRQAVIEARALADLVSRAGTTGDAVREAVKRFAAASPGVTGARVVIFEGMSLEASTVPADTGEKAAPRRLVKDEKALYDQGQRLRAAAETNKEDQVARKDEVERETLGSGVVAVAAPLEKDGAVIGFVRLERTPGIAPAAAPAFWVLLPLVLVPVLLMAGLVRVLPARRLPLTAAALVLLVLALAVYGEFGARYAAAGRRSAEAAVAEAAARTAGVAADVQKATAPDAAALDPANWDVDTFRRPLGLVTAGAAGLHTDEGALGTAVGRVTGSWRQVVTALGVLGLLVAALFGAGLAATLWRILVEHRQGYAYVAPAMIAMLVLVFFPFFYGIALSFTGSTIYNSDKSIPDIWVGVKNYVEIVGDFHVASRTPDGWVFNYQNFYWTLFLTIAWTVSNVAYGVTVGLILALILNIKGLRLRPIYRVLFVLPWAIPNYITALIWRGMFHQQFGVINQMIQMFGGSPVSWFEKPFTSFLAMFATNGYLSFPFMMVIALGALQSIPSDLYEAARVDGASRWRQFTSITLPSLKPALVPAIILSVVWTFNMFNIPYLVSAGEPAHSTEILITQAYKLAFEQYRYGYAAAYSTVIFMILLVYGSWQNRMTRATEGA